MECLMETAFRRKTDVVLIQEPPDRWGRCHPGFEYMWGGGRVMTARRRDSDWTFSTEDNLTREGEGDVQSIAVGRLGRAGRVVRVVNTYCQRRVGEEGRPGERAGWERLLEEGAIVAGDFNAHSPRWNSFCETARDQHFLEDLIDTYDLTVHNSDQATRPSSTVHSIIDLTLSTPGLASGLRGWQILGPADSTGSDHEVLEWGFRPEGAVADVSREARGWRVSDVTESEEAGKAAAADWRSRAAGRPVLSSESSAEAAEAEAQWIQSELTALMDVHCKKIRICARSKRWWRESIDEKRRLLGVLRGRRRTGRATAKEVRKARAALRADIRDAKRTTWGEFLHAAADDNVWSVMRYTKPMRETTVPTIRNGVGRVAETQGEKARMLAEMAFPAPVPYLGSAGERGAPGRAHERVGTRTVGAAIRGAGNTSPGPDRLGAAVVRLLWEWDEERVTALVRACIRLGLHPRAWKMAMGVTIPKPGKSDYGLAKSYRVISLLNCLGKVVEKVIANMLSEDTDRGNLLHPGQYGGRRGRSAVDAAGVLMSTVQEAWSRGKVAAALMMDVEAAFPSVARECLLRKMREIGLDEGLVGWVDSFMRDRRVRMVVDGQEGDEMEVTTGLPQGSPVSPILFAIYIAGVHGAVEEAVPGVRGLSFVDDVTWLAVGDSVGDVVGTLEESARQSGWWAADNAVRFEMSKTEAVLFTRNRRLWGQRQRMSVRVEGRDVPFTKEATRWLGIWLDPGLLMSDNRRKCIARARKAEAALRGLVGRNGVPPAAARNLQTAIVQSTMLYASELTWTGQEGPMSREYQLAINRMARSTLGCLPSTPLGALARESGLTPAHPLLDYRQARYAQRLMARPVGHGGPEEILERGGTALQERLVEAAGMEPEEDEYEAVVMPEGKAWEARVVIEAEEEALATAREWQSDDQTAWTDGSRLENGGVGAAVCWMEPADPHPEEWEGPGTVTRYRPGPRDERWTGSSWHLGVGRKEVFDAELFALHRAVQRFNRRGEHGANYTIFSDAQSAIRRCGGDGPGPGQCWARAVIELTEEMAERECTLTVRWVPSHADVEGNELADAMAKEAARSGVYGDRASMEEARVVSMARIRRRSTEARTRETARWIDERTRERRSYIPPRKSGWRKALRGERKALASRYYQLLTGHAITAPYMKEKLGKVDSDECWWCDAGVRQTRHHLFCECRAFRPQIVKLWKEVGEALGWKRRRKKRMRVADLFYREEVTEVVLEFLRTTGVGKFPPVQVERDENEEESESEAE
jgi:ribonuclease HI